MTWSLFAGSSSENSLNKCHLVHLFVLISLVFLAYANTLHVPFVFDDLPNIKNNQALAIQHLNFQELSEAAFAKPAKHRPVANISFALNYYLSGFSLPAFHLTNIIIHILAGLILYKVIFLTLKIGAPHPEKMTVHSRTAFFSAAIWLLNPVNTQAVTYIVQRMASLAALFYILSLLFFIQARITTKHRLTISYAIGCLVCGVLAVGSKENAIMLPFSLLTYEFFIFKEGHIARFKELQPYIIGTTFFFLIATTIYLGDSFWHVIISGYDTRDFSLYQRVLTQFRVVLFYLSQFFMPYPGRLNLDHNFLISNSLFEPWTTLVAIFAVGSILLVSYRMAYRFRIISFAIIWFFLNLIIESSVISLEIIFEHRIYLPSMFLGLLIVTGIGKFFSVKNKSLVFIAIILIFSFWTYQRNEVWHNELSLWHDVVAKSPGKARGYNEIGMYYFEHRQPAKAIGFFRRTLAFDNEQAISHNNLGLCLQAINQPDEAITEFRKAISIIPNYGMFHVNLGIAYMQKGLISKGQYELGQGKKLRTQNHF